VTVRILAPDEAIATEPDRPTVCVWWQSPTQDAGTTLCSVLAHTSSPVLVALSAGAKECVSEIEAAIAAVDSTAEVYAVWTTSNVSLTATVNAAYAMTSGDVALVSPGVEVGPEWLERLAAAVRCDSTVGSATALGNHAGHLSARSATRAIAQPEAALAVAGQASGIRPRIAVAGAHCVYLRRALLDRVGPLDASISDPEQAIAAMSLRALAVGMTHVAADDVYVLCPPGPMKSRSAVLAADFEDERTPLRRALARARVAMSGLSVTIDARALATGSGGTQTYTEQLVLALAASDVAHLRVVTPPDLPAPLAQRFGGEPKIEVVPYERAAAGVPLTDIVHRPQQVFTAEDLQLLQMLGERIVVGQQDLIAYHNPSYHENVELWHRHRRVTRLALTVADGVIVFSEHTKRDVVAEDLAPRDRCDVVGIGADSPGAIDEATEPVASVPERENLLLCLGADYGHKNRPFAIELLQALRERHGWTGRLVLAGTHVPYGSSHAEEQSLLAADRRLAASVIDVGRVTAAQRRWLYERACAVVYPTTFEGFGMMPFEAVAAGKPCLFAPQASLVEVAGVEAATLTPWDPARSADAVAPLLVDGPAREHHLGLLRSAAARARWADVARGLLGAYHRALDRPYRAGAPRAWQELERERMLQHADRVAHEYQDAYHGLSSEVAQGLPLIGKDGLLSQDEQRGLMRIAARASLRRVLLTPIGALGRVRSASPPRSER